MAKTVHFTKQTPRCATQRTIAVGLATVCALGCSAFSLDPPARPALSGDGDGGTSDGAIPFESSGSLDSSATAGADTPGAETLGGERSTGVSAPDTRSHPTPTPSAESQDASISSNGESLTSSVDHPGRTSAPSGSSQTRDAPSVETLEGTSANSPTTEATSTAATSTAPADPSTSTDDTTSSNGPCPLSHGETLGVYVSPAGDDGDSCGTRNAPCASIGQGLVRAAAASKANVYIAVGTYQEHVNLTAAISLTGGWTANGESWSRDCGEFADATVLNSNQAIGLRAQFNGRAELRSLTINTKPRDGTASESRYGIFATGANTQLELVDVVVRAASANHGSTGANGGTLPAVGCDAGNGTHGPVAATTPNTPAGSFTNTGYVPGDGFDGADGNPGQGGSDGADVTYQCTFCSIVNNQCQGAAGGERTASGGEHGCGGGNGTGGFGGSGGGASVGVFAWLATIEFGDDVVVVSGDGGNGANGGSGGNGETGSFGTAGEEIECNPGLSCGDPTCGYEFDGEPGTKGGNGSAGALGGAGAGGWSVPLVGTEDAFVGVANVSRVFGDAGVSLGSGPEGFAQTSYVVE